MATQHDNDTVLAKDLELISGLIEGYDHVGTGSSKYAARDAKEADEAMKRIRSALLQQKGK